MSIIDIYYIIYIQFLYRITKTKHNESIPTLQQLYKNHFHRIIALLLKSKMAATAISLVYWNSHHHLHTVKKKNKKYENYLIPKTIHCMAE